MDIHEKPFHPERVDADIDQFLQIHNQEEVAARPNVHLVHEMNDLYREESQVLDRAWTRLSQQIHISSPALPVSMQHNHIKKEKSQMENQAISGYKKHHGMRHLTRIGLGFVAALIVASMLVVLSLYQQSHTTSVTGNHATGATSSASTHGHVVYSTQKEDGNATVSWSADGKRVAVFHSANNLHGDTVQIWDALTGQHRISVQLGANELIYSIPQPWSPTSELLAIPTNTRVLIVNGQTGQIVTSYWATSGTLASAQTSSGALASLQVPSTANNALSYLMPLSSSSFFRSVVWSPDGKSIASTYSIGAGGGPGVIRIWNPYTGNVSASLTTQPGWSIDDISWSPNGEDIAANMSSLSGNLSQNQVGVWNVNTHQIVFQQAESHQLTGSTWQPNSHNLAFSLLTNESFNTAVLQIWNVDTKQLIKSFAGVAASTLTWSPSGKEIAYKNNTSGDTTAGVTLLNVDSGQKVYTYHVSAQAKQTVDISAPAWSPDGKYIVTSESSSPIPTTNNHVQQNPQQSYVVKIWAA